MAQETIRRLRTLALAAMALALLALPAAAAAKPRDRNHDGIPDKWEKKHHLSTKKHGVGKKDPDRDGLNNLAEFRSRTNPHKVDSDRDGLPDAGEDRDRDKVDNGNEARERTGPRDRDTDNDGIKDGREDRDHDGLNNAGEDAADTDPIDPDSDDDGIKDGQEEAGKVLAFDGSRLTLRLFNGEELTGSVDEGAEVECDDPSAEDSDGWSDDHEERHGGREAHGKVVRGEGEGGDDPGADEPGDDEGSDDEDSDDESDESHCSLDDIHVGTVVRGASIDVSRDGAYFSSIEIDPVE